MDLRMGAGRRKRRGRQRKEHMFESFFRFCCCACLATSVALSAPPQRAKEPVDYVDPYTRIFAVLCSSRRHVSWWLHLTASMEARDGPRNSSRTDSERPFSGCEQSSIPTSQ